MRVDFFGDLTCPWCHLGWRRLHAALAERPKVRAEVFWRPFQLNPDIPVTGISREDYLLRKYANAERVREVLLAIETAMKAEGLYINLHRIKVTAHTYMAHRLMLAAEKEGKAGVLLDAFFNAYFMAGEDIGDAAVLAKLGESARLPADAVQRALGSSEVLPEIQESEAQARQLAIRAVPFFLFDRKYSIAGAHDPIAFLPLIDLCETAPPVDLLSARDAAG